MTRLQPTRAEGPALDTARSDGERSSSKSPASSGQTGMFPEPGPSEERPNRLSQLKSLVDEAVKLARTILPGTQLDTDDPHRKFSRYLPGNSQQSWLDDELVIITSSSTCHPVVDNLQISVEFIQLANTEFLHDLCWKVLNPLA